MKRAFWKNTRGSVALMNGVAFLVVAMAAGGALDYSNATKKRAELQKATDAAALAGASLPFAEDQERMEQAERMFLGSKFCEQNKCETPTIEMVDDMVKITASADVKTSLLQLIGKTKVEIGADSVAAPITATPVDVVMVLDYSGSMNSNNKYQNMADAAERFLENAESLPDDSLAVGVVPFSKFVLTPMEGRYLYDVSAGNDLTGQTVIGCILNREHPHSTNAAAPSTGVQGSLWPVFSYSTNTSPGASGSYSDTYTGPGAPSYATGFYSYTLPGGTTADYTLTSYDNDPGVAPTSITATYWLDAAGNEGIQFDGHGKFNFSVSSSSNSPLSIVNMGNVPQNDPFAQYGGYGGSNNWTFGDDSGLPSSYDQNRVQEDLSGACVQYAQNELWARPLSKDFSELKRGIGQMRPIGLTNIALGLDLGWHMLTPEAPFVEANTDERTEKVAILLTDGVQTVQAHGDGGNISISSANSNIAESCEAMKNEGIEVFTIAFDIHDGFTRNLLQNCATAEPYYFEPSAGDELDEVFDAIFNKIASGRVRLTG